MTKIACIGEVMIELSLQTAETAQIGIAGDTYNTALYSRAPAEGSRRGALRYCLRVRMRFLIGFWHICKPTELRKIAWRDIQQKHLASMQSKQMIRASGDLVIGDLTVPHAHCLAPNVQLDLNILTQFDLVYVIGHILGHLAAHATPRPD